MMLPAQVRMRTIPMRWNKIGKMMAAVTRIVTACTQTAVRETAASTPSGMRRRKWVWTRRQQVTMCGLLTLQKSLTRKGRKMSKI